MIFGSADPHRDFEMTLNATQLLDKHYQALPGKLAYFVAKSAVRRMDIVASTLELHCPAKVSLIDGVFKR